MFQLTLRTDTSLLESTVRHITKPFWGVCVYVCIRSLCEKSLSCLLLYLLKNKC